MKITTVFLLVLTMILFFVSCEQKSPEVRISSDVIETNNVYNTVITELNGKKVVRGKLIEIRFRSRGEDDILIFEDGTIIPVVNAEDFTWQLKKVCYIELGKSFPGSAYKKEIRSVQ